MNKPHVRRLHRRELPADTEKLARFLIGKVLVHDRPEGITSGRIVETEAYVIGDRAGHAFIGETPRNRSLFLERGHAYVYFIYGTSFLFNVSSERSGVGAGVLVRALEPLEGIELMERRRRTKRLLDLSRGPGRLTVAMRIGPRQDGADLCSGGPLWIGRTSQRPSAVGTSVRIGITHEAQRVLRFYERANPFVSGPRRMRD